MTNNANYNKQIMAEHIKEKLNQNDMTAKEFSDKLGFKYTTVLDWIHAKTYPRIDKIEKMANFFGVDKADLIEPHRDPREDDLKTADLADDDTIFTFEGKPIPEQDLEYMKRLLRGGRK